jgi:hypothetical protein
LKPWSVPSRPKIITSAAAVSTTLTTKLRSSVSPRIRPFTRPRSVVTRTPATSIVPNVISHHAAPAPNTWTSSPRVVPSLTGVRSASTVA